MVSVSRQFVLSREACHPITGCSVKALLTASHLADRLPARFAFKAPDSHWDISGCQVTAHGSLRCTCMSFLYEHTLQIPVLQIQTQWQCAWQLELVLVTAWNSEIWRVLHRSVYIYIFFWGLMTRLCEFCNHSICHSCLCVCHIKITFAPPCQFICFFFFFKLLNTVLATQGSWIHIVKMQILDGYF